MLVLRRRAQESVFLEVPGLDEPIQVKILGIARGEVSLAFGAPDSVRILREELYERKEHESD